MPNSKKHEGRNVKCFRDILGIKQGALANKLDKVCPEHGGGIWNQQKISLLEQKETIDPALRQQISAALKIPYEAIQNFDEEQAITVISSTFNDGTAIVQHNRVFNPLDTVIKMHEEKMALNERMIEA